MSLQSKPKKQKFSGFSVAKAFQYLRLAKLTPWDIQADPASPSDFFQQRLQKLQRFDLRASEEAKKLLIDAVLEEGLEGFRHLKIWKGANLETDNVEGYVDYLVAEDRDYLYAPFLCVIEAKKDDFEQGLAQCPVEMAACQWNNRQIGRDIPVFGIVTNGEGWKFYQLLLTGQVEETNL
ncbi:hypothetical protein [Vacuolonema iberomarrocanum]|uniref:hypothetical protein n=1 Tax=Vacuolonema iberomarrocanum TaxID=3454632 RepID=UPI0019F5DD9A|nr:hypothetical protein [filamentous cyanobacterium LEGE 07170]